MKKPKRPISRVELAGYLVSPALFVMIVLMIVEATLAAGTTWLVINAGRKVATGQFLLSDLIWILTAQSTSYVAGVVSWVYAESAGYRGFGKFILRFARENRGKVKLFNDKPAREQVEPFLTGEAFQCFFNVMYELEFTLKLFLGMVFNALVLGVEIDVSLPFAYVGAFGALLAMQWALQKPIARTYLENQRMNNRVTAQGYTAWDNIFAGNRYNLRLWLAGFKSRLRVALGAQVRAIVAREGMSAMSGIVSLAIVFATVTVVAVHHTGDMVFLVALATTLAAADRDDLRIASPRRRVERLHRGVDALRRRRRQHAAAARTGLRGPHPLRPPGAARRRPRQRGVLAQRRAAHRRSQPDRPHQHPRRNGAGKSSLLASLKTELKQRAYYWPTSDRLAFQFAGGVVPAHIETSDEDEMEDAEEPAEEQTGFSSGERQLKSLEEIVNSTDARFYLFDEWDANLDAANKAKADALVDALAARARVVEISHRDRGK